MTKPFKKIAVIGTGTLGAQIAMLASNAGYQITVFDQQPGAFDAMLEKLKADMTARQIEPFIPYDRWPVCRQQIKKIDKGELGVKSGKGFYSYPDPEYLQDGFLSTED
jgi:3-hydroxyacyl-CoA dehydrogenase